MLTVEQLIERLKEFPPDMQVLTCLKGYADVFHEIAHKGDVKVELSRRGDQRVFCVIHPEPDVQ